MTTFRVARAARPSKPNPKPKVKRSERSQQHEPIEEVQIVQHPAGRNQARRVTRFVMAATILFLVVILAFLAPAASTPSQLLTNYGAEILHTIPQDARGVRVLPASGSYAVNWLTSVRYTVSSIDDEQGQYISMYPNQVDDFPGRTRWSLTSHVEIERLAIISTIVLVVLGSFMFLITNNSRKWDYEIPEVGGSVESALRVEVKNSWVSAQRFYSGSLYLLIAGVLMAFLGMVTFFTALPDFATFSGADKVSSIHWELYAVAAIRPLGLLIFIEAIAWFFLRQYRSATEDFKAFHRIYLRRSNYFAARKAYAELPTQEKSLTIAAALLSEDLSGRLTQGQSTEAIEAMKVDDANPIFGLLNGAISGMRGERKKAGDEKPKEGSEKEKKE